MAKNKPKKKTYTQLYNLVYVIRRFVKIIIVFYIQTATAVIPGKHHNPVVYDSIQYQRKTRIYNVPLLQTNILYL